MAALLVSVRSATEALAALAGGASILDVKEPDRGPLGRADASVWQAVRRVVPRSVPVSVALGELADWRDNLATPADFEGIAFRKLGPAGCGRGWADAWALAVAGGQGGPSWVAVAYADGEAAGAPGLGEIIASALVAHECAGVLIDTWDKSAPHPPDLGWRPLLRRVRESGKFVALAGGLDEAAIARLAPFTPDIVAVRGSACGQGDRRGTIDAGRVASLARAAAHLP